MKRTVSALVALLAVAAAPAHAQSVASSLRTMAADNARGWLSPLVEGVGHALSGGFVEGAEPLDRLQVRVGVRLSAAIFERDHAAFEAVLPASLTWNGTAYTDPYEASGSFLRTPTAVGKGTGVLLRPRRGSAFERDLIIAEENPNGEAWALRLPDGFDIPAAPLVVLDASVGVGAGTELAARFAPSVEVSGDIGSLQALGASLLHDVDRYFPGPLPVELALFAGFQRLEAGDWLDASAATFGAVASRELMPLTVYGHVSVARATADVSYVAANPSGNPARPAAGSRVAFAADPGTSVRAAAGAVLDLVVFDLSAEYALATFDTFAARVSFAVR